MATELQKKAAGDLCFSPRNAVQLHNFFPSISFPLAFLVYCLSKVHEHSFLGSKCWHADNKLPFILNF